MQNYLNLLKRVVETGVDTPDRTGVGRRRIFGVLERFDISNGKLPCVTTRYINIQHAIHEMVMFIYGFTNIEFLNQAGIKIWNDWAVTAETPKGMLDKYIERGWSTVEQALVALGKYGNQAEGEIGPMYGTMWRFWPRTNYNINKAEQTMTVDQMPVDQIEALTASYQDLDDKQKAQVSLEDWLIRHYYSVVDQLGELIHNLKTDPYSSRHIVTAFNPEYTPIPGFTPAENVLMSKGCLMPCHIGFEIFVEPPKEEGGKMQLSLKFNMRSTDVCVGLPTNLNGYAILANLIARTVDMETKELIFAGTDVHVYLNHLEGIEKQLQREPHPGPTISINPELKDIFRVKPEDITFSNYTHHDKIVYPVAV